MRNAPVFDDYFLFAITNTILQCDDMYFIQNMIFIVIAGNNKNTGKINRLYKNAKILLRM